MPNILTLIYSKKKEKYSPKNISVTLQKFQKYRFRGEHHYYLRQLKKKRFLYCFRSRIATFHRLFQECWLAGEVALEPRDTALYSWVWGTKNRCSDGAAEEAADHESQMSLASSRNPSLQQVLPEQARPVPQPATWPRGLSMSTNVLYSLKHYSRGRTGEICNCLKQIKQPQPN